MELFFLNTKRGSAGGSALARLMNVKRLAKKRLQGFVASPDKVVINWGNSDIPKEVVGCNIVNSPGAVGMAVNKLTSFAKMQGTVRIPEYTTDKSIALAWMVEMGTAVVVRHVLTGSGGDGIEIVNTPQQLLESEDAPMYVQYVPKKSEYRLHVFGNEVFDIQQKLRRRDVPDEDVNWKVRNHANGFIYGREFGDMDIDKWELLKNQAVHAVKALKLDFGGVDVIWNEKQHKAYVLEVNTAPGMEGSTVEHYSERFLQAFTPPMRHERRLLKTPNKPLGKINFEEAFINLKQDWALVDPGVNAVQKPGF